MGMTSILGYIWVLSPKTPKKEFGKLVDKLAEELELKRKHLEEFEAIHVVYDEDL